MTTLNTPWQEAKAKLPSRRQDILGLEMVGLLHDLYKLRTKFLESLSEKGWQGDLEDPQCAGLKAYQVSLGNFNGSLYDLLITEPPPEITSTRGIHGWAHFAKEEAEEKFSQRLPNIFLGSAFGNESPIPPALTDELKALPLQNVGSILENYAAYRELLEKLQGRMGQSIAETRRPTNDVSLWDWSYIVAGFTKCLAAYAVLGDIPWMQAPRVRILSVALNALNAYQQTLGVSDLLGVKQEIEAAFGRLEPMLAWEYPLAARLYADESGAYYLFPNYEPDQAFTEEVQSLFPPDLLPEVLLSEPIALMDLDPKQGNQAVRSRKTCQKLIAEPRQQGMKIEYPVPPKGLWQKEWQGADEEHPPEICPVCGLRPIGYWETGLEAWATAQKAAERKICAVCLSRRGRRSQKWLDDVSEENLPTIWVDEVADQNGRLALVVGGFDLKRWLDGRLFETTLVKGYGTTEIDPVTKNATPARLLRLWKTTQSFWLGVQQALPACVGVCPARLAFSVKGNDFGASHVYEIALGSTRLSVVWDGKRFISAHNLAYFARLLGATPTDPYIDSQSAEPWEAQAVKKHLQQNRHSLRLYEPQGYGFESGPGRQVTLQGEPEILSLAYLPAIPVLSEPGMFMALLPADRALAALAAVRSAYRQQMGKVLNRLPLQLGVVYAPQHTPLRVLLETGRRMLNRSAPDGAARQWQVIAIEDISKQGASRPHFTRARRLSLQNLADASKTVQWDIPLCMGDGSKDDWYPYVQLLSGSVSGTSLDFAIPDPWVEETAEGAEAGQVNFIHASRLSMGDKIHFTPATLDVQWLGSAAQRFEVSYDEQGQRVNDPRRPFLLEQIGDFELVWKAVSSQLSMSQIYALRDTIEFKRQEWQTERHDATFRQFCQAALMNAGWKEQPWEQGCGYDFWTLDQWTEFAASGDLNAVLQIYLQIMKEKVEDNSQ